MNSCLVNCQVYHHRFQPKKYSHATKMYWFKLDYSELNELHSDNWWFSYNKFNIYAFWDRDHFLYDLSSNLKKSYMDILAKNNELVLIDRITIYTHCRLFGYVFNPVCFVVLDLEDNRQCGVVEVSNTFGEIKYYFIPSSAFTSRDQFCYRLEKNFYVSPFSDSRSEFEFKFYAKDNKLNISVNDYFEQNLILSSGVRGRTLDITFFNQLKMFVFYPFVTFKIIFLIHLHAGILYLKKVPYFKKQQQIDFQTQYKKRNDL